MATLGSIPSCPWRGTPKASTSRAPGGRPSGPTVAHTPRAGPVSHGLSDSSMSMSISPGMASSGASSPVCEMAERSALDAVRDMCLAADPAPRIVCVGDIGMPVGIPRVLVAVCAMSAIDLIWPPAVARYSGALASWPLLRFSRSVLRRSASACSCFTARRFARALARAPAHFKRAPWPVEVSTALYTMFTTTLSIHRTTSFLASKRCCRSAFCLFSALVTKEKASFQAAVALGVGSQISTLVSLASSRMLPPWRIAVSISITP
mmetsp:Transcript_53685/g.138291  ORF Transcript_53685/g.138291 Transcript_53685/m.138291 type:complete len:264 (-) Transcript_53685:470-1261(-)